SEDAAVRAETERLRGARGRGNDGVPRRLPAVAHPAHELFGIAAVRARNGVGPEDDGEPGRRQGAAKRGRRERERPLHGGEALLRIVADPEKARLVVEVFAEDEAALRIEVRLLRGKLRERRFVREDAVLD